MPSKEALDLLDALKENPSMASSINWDQLATDEPDLNIGKMRLDLGIAKHKSAVPTGSIMDFLLTKPERSEDLLEEKVPMLQIPRISKEAISVLPEQGVGPVSPKMAGMLANLLLGGGELIANLPGFALRAAETRYVGDEPTELDIISPEGKLQVPEMAKSIVAPAAKLAAGIKTKGETEAGKRLYEEAVGESIEHPEGLLMPLLMALGGREAVKGKVSAKAKTIPESLQKAIQKQKVIVTEKVTPKVTEPKSTVETPTGDIARLNKADTDLIRRETKLEQLPEHEVKTWKRTLAEARETGHVEKAVDVANEVVNSKRPVTDVEHAGMTLRLAELKNEYNQAIAEVAKQAEKGNRSGVKIEQGRLDNILDQMDALTEARRLGGREAARALALGRMGINIKTYDIASVMQRATATKGKKLTPKQTTDIQNIAKKYEIAEKKVKDLEVKNDAIIAENERLLAERIAKTEAQKAKITSKAAGSRQRISSDRAQLKKEIAMLGLRVSDITGITPEAAHLIGKLAISYIKEGVVTLDAVVKRVLTDLPDLTNRDVYRALNTKDPKAQARIRSETTKNIANLKKQAQLLLDIERAERGIFKEPTTKASTVPLEIKALQQRLRELRKQVYDTVKKSDKLEKAVRTINELQDQLDNYYRNIKAKRKPDTGEMKELTEKMSDLRKQLRVQDAIIDLENQLKTGNYKIPEPKKIKPDSPELANAKIELSLLRKKVDAHIEMLSPLTVGKTIQEVVNTLRTLKATADVSATGRQGLILGANTNPGAMARIQARSLKAAADPKWAERIDMEIKSDPKYYLAEKSKLHLTEHETANVLAKEEMFMSNIAEKIPVIGRGVRASNRHMVSYLNQLRFHNFKWYVERFPNATHAELTAWADCINVWSGRGNLGSFAKAANTLSLGFFAPRFAVSRFQSPYMVFKNLKNPRTRRVIAKDMTRVLVLGLSILKMADMLGAEVNWDNPRKSDWGKIKIGNTRIDIWGGLQQPMRLTIRLGTGLTDKFGLTGGGLSESEKRINPLDEISRFSMYKVAPAISVPAELYMGKSLVGEPREPLETAINAITPMVIEDFRDAYEDAGLNQALWAGGLNFLGVSANTYRKRNTRGR